MQLVRMDIVPTCDPTIASGARLPSAMRATCTADHLPPRAAGMPRSPSPAAMGGRSSAAMRLTTSTFDIIKSDA